MITRDEPVEIAVDEQHIEGRLIAGATAGPAVLFVHGWGGNQQQYLSRARAVAGLGFICLTFDLRGHARSDEQRETVSRQNNLTDLLAAYDVLSEQPGVDSTAIGMVGSSYGAYLAAIMTAQRPVRWLALRAPALYNDTGWDLPKRQLHADPDFSAYRRRAVPAEENLALRACAAFRGNVLLVESEKDDVVPHPVIANYLAACTHAQSVTYRMIEGADHSLSDASWQHTSTSFLLQWLADRIIGEQPRADDAPE
jgi:pimeloyl-ACP methyl ester carboxylesterase